MSLGTILLIVLIIALVGVIPAWPTAEASWSKQHRRAIWSLLILFLLGKIRARESQVRSRRGSAAIGKAGPA
jgi:hypothetical protein